MILFASPEFEHIAAGLRESVPSTAFRTPARPWYPRAKDSFAPVWRIPRSW